MKNHEYHSSGDGFICKTTGKRTSYVFWNDLQHKGDDYCPHCNENTPSKALHELNKKREQESLN